MLAAVGRQVDGCLICPLGGSTGQVGQSQQIVQQCVHAGLLELVVGGQGLVEAGEDGQPRGEDVNLAALSAQLGLQALARLL